MKIATWNVNGIRAREKDFGEFLLREDPDVLCLQELKAEPHQVPESCRVSGYETCWHGMRGYSGVSLHVRRELLARPPAFAHPDFDMETRIVTAEIDDLVLASVYVPNGGKDYRAKLDFLASLARWIRDVHEAGRKLVLCGDINVTRADIDVHPKERKPDVIGQRPEERQLFGALLGEGLLDIVRELNPDNPGLFSWWAPWRSMRQRNIGWRIDYVLVSKVLADRVETGGVRASFGTSDHAPVVVTTV